MFIFNRKAYGAFIFATFFVVCFSHAGHFSVSDQKVQEFYDQCSVKISDSELESQLQDSLLAQQYRRLSPVGEQNLSYYNLSRRFLRMTSAPIIDLDGFQFQRVSAVELGLLLRLTTHNDSRWSGQEYQVKADVSDSEVLKIHRKCLTSICEERSLQNPDLLYGLQKINNEQPLCDSALCVTKRIFGQDKGLYILYAADRYGLNMTNYADINADPEGFPANSLKIILQAVELIPQETWGDVVIDDSFQRFSKGRYRLINGPNTLANAGGDIFDLFFNKSPARQLYILFHELGHRIHYKLKQKGLDQVPTSPSVSDYGKTNENEDFAESYALFRMQPKRLYELSPERFEYFQEKAFAGYSFLNHLCSGEKQVPMESL